MDFYLKSQVIVNMNNKNIIYTMDTQCRFNYSGSKYNDN